MSQSTSRKKVVVLQHRLLHYRVKLFENLRVMLSESGIDFRLVHGQATADELKKNDTGTIGWADEVVNRYLRILGRDVLWQPFPRFHADASLIVLMQENRLISNYPFLFSPRDSGRRIAYWGHGRNLQSESPRGLRERWKASMVSKVDWWFAYTDLTKGILESDGFPADRISVLNNAIDNESFQRDLASVSDAEIANLRASFGVGTAGAIGIFCGSLYPIKKIGYMIAAADRIRAERSDFSLVVIGDGPSAEEIKAAASRRPWLHWVGVKHGRDKAAYFRMADVVFNPGAVGLHVLDALCSSTPMITTRAAQHGPEIAYLRNGHNGIVVDGESEDYALAVLSLLRDRRRLDEFKRSAGQDAALYTLDNMAERFSAGVMRCLSLPRLVA